MWKVVSMRDMSAGTGTLGRAVFAAASIVLLVTFGMPGTAFAEGSDTERSVDDQTAKEVLKLLRSGKKAYDAEDYETAYKRFQNAYEKWPRPAILVRLGKTAEELGKDKEAIGHYKAFLKEKPDSKLAEKIEGKLAALQKKQKPQKTTVSLESKPGGAEVYLGAGDGKKLGRTPLETKLEVGEATLVLRLAGYEDVERSVTLKAGEKKTLEIQLEAEESDKTPEAQAMKEPPPEGTSGGGAGNALGAFGWTSTFTGIAGIGTGVVFSLLKSQSVKDVNSYERGVSGASRSELDGMKSTAESQHRASLIAYSAGGAMTTLGVTMLIYHFASKGEGSKKARIAPNLGAAPGAGWAGVKVDF